MGQNEMIFYIVAAGCMICLMSAFAAGSFLCDDRIWNQHCLYAERNHSTSQS